MIEPLKVLKVVSEGAGAPLQDGAGTHTKYDIPLALNRPVTDEEQGRIRRVWQRHQQGLAQGEWTLLGVEEDRLTLMNTTVEALKDRLAGVVRAMLAEVNAETARAAEQHAERERLLAEHRDHVESVARDIDWSGDD